MVVKSDFAHCHNLGMPKQILQILERVQIHFSSIVRVHANGGIYAGISFGQAHRHFEIWRTVAGPDGQHVL